MFGLDSELSKAEAAGRYVRDPTADNLLYLIEEYDLTQEEVQEYQQATLNNMQYQMALEETRQQLREEKVGNWTNLLEEGATGSIEAVGSAAQTTTTEVGETLGAAGRTTFEDVLGETAVGVRNAYEKARGQEKQQAS
jgi:hypothetical protein